jgi:molybdopterin-guanine dinucleotide biosynthesis protein A
MGGGDKPLLPIAGRPMLASIIETLEPMPIAISANGDPARFAGFGLPVLPDGPFVDQGPLAGILAGLDWAAGSGAEFLLSVPGDTPLIPRDLPIRLTPAPACAASRGLIHPLVALWPVACRTTLVAWLSRPGSRAAIEFGRSIGMRVVDFPVRDPDPFLNVNTPGELAEIQARTESKRAGGAG